MAIAAGGASTGNIRHVCERDDCSLGNTYYGAILLLLTYGC